VRQEQYDPGAYKIRKGAVPDRGRGLGYTAPTYTCRATRDRTLLRLRRLCIFPPLRAHLDTDAPKPMVTSDTAAVIAAKKVLRDRIRAWRAGLDGQAVVRAADAVAKHGVGFLEAKPAMVVSGFAPLPDEFRLWPLLRSVAGQGYRLALPVMQGKGKPLIFRQWSPGDAMDSGVWGIAEPKADKAELEPDILLVPLLAFDAAGWRLGYGGSFYDRTLKGLRARKSVVAVGIAFDEQRVDAVPHLDYDERLDWVLTPSGPFRCHPTQ
jgi:5-formyltetrahydrofolate cyclo-ligase